MSMEKVIEQLKKDLLGKSIKEEDLKENLKKQGFEEEDVNAIIGKMASTSGFSGMNDKWTYRGEDYVAPLPPNQPH